MMHAHETEEKRFGVENLSAMAALPEFNLSSGVIVDSVHCVFEGVTKTFTEMILNEAGYDWYIGDSANRKLINDQIKKIQTPT